LRAEVDPTEAVRHDGAVMECEKKGGVSATTGKCPVRSYPHGRSRQRVGPELGANA